MTSFQNATLPIETNALTNATALQPFAANNGIRELTIDELNDVSGGLDPFSMLVGGATVVVGYVITKWLIS